MSEIEKKTQELNKRLKSSVLTKEWLERTIISLGLYGMILGTIGPFYITNVNGMMIIRRRPKNFHMSMTEASISNRNNMASATKFAMFLKSIDCIYKVWKKVSLKGTNPFTMLIKHNKKHLVNDRPSIKNIITPEGYDLYIENIIAADKKGKITISKDYSFSENEKLVIVMIATDPVKKGYSDYECFELNRSSVVAGQEIELTKSQKAVCSNYKKFIIYSAVVKEKGKEVQWSNTCVSECEFEFNVDYEKAEMYGYGQILSDSHLLTIMRKRNLIVVKPPG